MFLLVGEVTKASGIPARLQAAGECTGARRLRRSDSVNRVEASRVKADTISPAVKLPVISRAKPIRVGPTNPPRLPIELIAAMPAAALRPDRNSVGKVQNGGRAAMTPAMATERKPWSIPGGR